MTLVHRVIYEAFIGPIPPKHDIDHLCRNTSCCNPLHLEAVPRAENVRRGIGWERGVAVAADKAKASAHCKNGHEYTDGNTYYYTTKRGEEKRMCRACRRINGALHIERRTEN